VPTDTIEVDCDGCGCEVDEDDIEHTSDGYDVCDDCRESCEWCNRSFHYLSDHQDYRCDNCGEDFCCDADYSWCEDCERYTCPDCSGCECGEYSGSVHQWDWKPHRYKPKGLWRDGQALLGLELEVGMSASQIVPAVQAVDDCEEHLYMKQDGSICGVEIVSHPATLDWSRDYPYGEMLRILRNNGCHVDDGYGLHVHVSRNAFRSQSSAAAHQMSWLMFLYRNTDALEHLARRTSERWASFKKPLQGELKRKASHPDDRSSRYVAVNCNNERTYELRFFASTLEEQELRAALEFADASVQYTKAIKTHDILRGNALSWDKFETWTGDNNYPNLLAEMAKF
jgi:hypothetical protein